MAEISDVIVTGENEIELERLVLGIPLLRPETLDLLITHARPDYFIHPVHRKLFAALTHLYTSGLTVTFDTLKDQLIRDEALDEVGGIEYLYLLIEHPPAVDYNQYLHRLRERYLRRNFRALLEKYQELSVDPSRAPEDLIKHLEMDLNEMQVSYDEKGLRPIKSPLNELWKHLDRLSQLKTEVTGLPTDFTSLDDLTSGFQRGDLIIIAGRPRMGKTALALNFSLNLARNHYKVCFFSLEMAAQQLLQRILAIISRIELQKIRRARFHTSDWEKITVAISQLSTYDFYINDTPGLSVQDIRAQCRDMQRTRGLDAVFIDYLQLLHSSTRHENRQQEVTAISRSLKELSKELDAPVVALSQLSRNPDRREDNRPQLADLRESGSIEQDADVVMFIYREEVYRHGTPNKGETELIVAKQRNGPTDTLRLIFQQHIQKFDAIDPKYEDQFVT